MKSLISDELLLEIITAFYQTATQDILIGYHFRNIKNFDQHLPHIAAFWALQLNGETKLVHEKFDLIKAHLPLHIKRGELDRWLKLFSLNLNSFKIDSKIEKVWSERLTFFAKKLEKIITS